MMYAEGRSQDPPISTICCFLQYLSCLLSPPSSGELESRPKIRTIRALAGEGIVSRLSPDRQRSLFSWTMDRYIGNGDNSSWDLGVEIGGEIAKDPSLCIFALLTAGDFTEPEPPSSQWDGAGTKAPNGRKKLGENKICMRFPGRKFFAI